MPAPDRTAPVERPIAPAIAARWSPRAFEDRPVPEDLLLTVLEAARWAPSSNNAQPWHYVLARRHSEPDAFARLLGCLTPGNQVWVPFAPVLMISMARLAFPNGNPNRHAWHDTGAASVSLAIQAAALGLQAHQMAGFDVAKAREVLGLPEGFDPVAAIALGYPGAPEMLPEPQRTRETQPRVRRPVADFAVIGAWGGRPVGD
jgi:nitroreductase